MIYAVLSSAPVFFFLLGTVFLPQTNPVFKKLLHESHVYMIMRILTSS